LTGLLGRSQITAAQDRKEEVVEIPEWGGSVRILTIVGPERVAFEKACRAHAKGEMTSVELAARGASLGIVDQDGRRIFESADDEAALTAKNPAVLSRVLAAVFRVSFIGEGEVEEELGESSSDPNSPSDTASL
jgi:hypothetical protein